MQHVQEVDSQLGRPTASPQRRIRVWRCRAEKILLSDGLHTRQAELYHQVAGGDRKAHQKNVYVVTRNLWRTKPPCNIKRHCASRREPSEKVAPMEHASAPSSCSNINQRLQRLAQRREPCKRECAMERRFQISTFEAISEDEGMDQT